MSRMSGLIYGLYIRFLVWLGAEPPPDYENLIQGKASTKQYTLKPGDTIYSVARRFSVHYDLIAKANGIEDPSSVRPGQTLTIPAKDWKPVPEPVVKQPAAPPPETPPAKPAEAPPVERPVVKEIETPPPVRQVEIAPPARPQPPAEEEVPDWFFETAPAEEVEEEAPPADVTEVEWPMAEEETQPEPVDSAVIAEIPAAEVESSPAVAATVAEPEIAAPLSEMVFRYEIQRGDTLSDVAKRYGLTLKELVEANNITDPNRIFPGQKLIIPGYQLPKPQPEAEVQAPPPPLPGPDQQFIYTIVSGDTLNTIAKRYGITVRELIEANQIDNPNMLQIGQRLIIPGVFKPATPAAPAHPTLPMPPQPASSPAPAGAVRGVYMSYFAIGHPETRQHIFDLLANSELNALVIDVKGDFGLLSYPTQIPLAREIGAARPTAKDFQEVMARLKEQGVYTIARIVTFKDTPLAKAYPDIAVKTGSGEIWQDREGANWLDPFLKPAWDYNIQIAVEAARLGFDEIQFDSLRFPVSGLAGTPHFSQEVTKDSRVAAIAGFLSIARGQLSSLGVKISAKTFGYACWRKDDSLIGQDIERMAQYLDILSPMLYPSTFDNGIPGYKFAVAHPYEVVYESATRAVKRVKWLGCAVRPWIQDFQDYRFDKRAYGKEEIQAQIKGCFDAEADGFLVWNPQVNYTDAAYVSMVMA